MKRVTAIIMVALFSLAILSSISFNTQMALAQENAYTIQSVDHEVELLYSGHIVIRDTIQLSGQLSGDFLMGFPYKYGSYVLKGIAYNENNIFPLSLGVQLEDRTGFYGVRIIGFPEGETQVFTVVLILSNSLLDRNVTANVFTLDFPAYPSFVTDASRCNVEIILPEAPGTITVAKADGEVRATNFVRENLPAFTYSPAVANFTLSANSLQIIDIKELNRQITINPVGEIAAFDSYRITNNSPASLGSLSIGLPIDASDIVVRDEFGRTLTTKVLTSSGKTRLVNVTLVSSITSSTSTLLTAEYNLPNVSEQDSHYALNFGLFPDFDYYVDTAKITFILPEGARFITPQFASLDFSSNVVRDIFQETLSISRKGISKVDSSVLSEDTLQISYDYNPLWLSFRPTLWTWTLALVGCVVVAVWKRPKTSAPLRIAAPATAIILSPDHVRAFIEAYEEKNRVTSELKTLEARAQKGKIPRRRYKVQKRTLKVRLDTISKNISELKKIFRGSGGIYANLARQLDAAEIELVEVETNIRTIEVRHRRGDLPLEAYKKSQASYERRKEKAESTINGILLRIREEIR